MRINARLDKATERKVTYLKEVTQQSHTNIVKDAIALYYQNTYAQTAYKMQSLLSSDFIGCAQGDTDLSTDYKDHLADSLSRKHDID